VKTSNLTSETFLSLVPFKPGIQAKAQVEGGPTLEASIEQEKHTFQGRRDMMQILIYCAM
jgi:hypothetical protein